MDVELSLARRWAALMVPALAAPLAFYAVLFGLLRGSSGILLLGGGAATEAEEAQGLVVIVVGVAILAAGYVVTAALTGDRALGRGGLSLGVALCVFLVGEDLVAPFRAWDAVPGLAAGTAAAVALGGASVGRFALRVGAVVASAALVVTVGRELGGDDWQLAVGMIAGVVAVGWADTVADLAAAGRAHIALAVAVAAPIAVGSFLLLHERPAARVAPRPGPPVQVVDGGRALWSTASLPPVVAGPVGSGGRVFVLTEDGVLHAWNGADGALLWEVEAPGAVRLVAADSVVVTAGPGLLRAVDAATGSERWRLAPAMSVAVRPGWVDGVLVVASPDDGAWIGMDADTGHELWRIPTPPGAVLGDPVGGGPLALLAAGPELVAVDARTGRVEWRSLLTAEPRVFSVTSQGVYVEVDGVHLRLASTAGSVIETVAVPARPAGATNPVFAGGVAYVGVAAADGTGAVVALDPGSGREHWRVRVPGAVHSPPALTPAGLVVAASGPCDEDGCDSTLLALSR